MAEIIEEKEGITSKKVGWTDKEVLMDYRIEDLFYGHHSSFSFGRSMPFIRPHGQAAYFLYIIRVFKYLYVAIYMDWTIIIRHPINFFLLVTFFSVSIGLLFVAGIFLPVISISRWFRSKRNTVMTSWTEILNKTKPDSILKDDLMEGMKLLGSKKETKASTYSVIIKDGKKPSALGEWENLKRINKLKTILFFSTLVYKRETRVTSKIQDCVRKLKSKLKYDENDDQKVYKKVYETLVKYDKKESHHINNQHHHNNNQHHHHYNNQYHHHNNNEENKYSFESIERKIRDMIEIDEEEVKEQIKEFNLNYTTISELNTDDGGSFCGMFWSETDNFIVVSFKGTTPTNFAEWLGNLTFQCVDARNYLFGQVHRGFYNYLFPIDEESAGKNYPCQKIIEAINCKANTLKNKTGKKVNVWVTGHSLGGALATLFYARLLNVNYTHDAWDFQGAITFASPAVGDINFATQLASLINDPRNVTKPLWRIVLDNDFVPKMPYRACNKRMRKYGYHYNVLMNFAQVGDKVTFYGGDNDPSSIKEFFNNTSDTSNDGGEHASRLKSYCKQYYRSPKKSSYRISGYRHGANSYFRALVEYEKKLTKKELLDKDTSDSSWSTPFVNLISGFIKKS